MTKRLALAAYLAVWAVVAAGIDGVMQAGYSLWTGIALAYLPFQFLNGSIAYVVRRRQLLQEGETPPPYLQYLFFPTELPKLKREAPGDVHIFTSVIAAVAGAFFIFCGVALTVNAEWSHIENPFLAAVQCLIPTGIGAGFLCGAWRIFAAGKRAPLHQRMNDEELAALAQWESENLGLAHDPPLGTTDWPGWKEVAMRCAGPMIRRSGGNSS